ncbi:MAG: hypothetical protein LBL79_09960, partial [Prevotella sp.]|nr:hypothetical protein [Prevotella sp.]
SDDEKEEKFFNGDCIQTISLESGPANGPYSTPKALSTLDDMLKNVAGYGSPISSGSLHTTGENTEVKIYGLPVGTALKDLKITINNGIAENFGEVSNEKGNLNLYTGHDTFFKKAFDQMVSNKKLETVISFTPTIQVTNEVSLKIVFSGRFSYWVKI